MLRADCCGTSTATLGRHARRVAASFDEPPVFDLGVIEADAQLLTLQKRFVNSMQAASLLRAVLWPLNSG